MSVDPDVIEILERDSKSFFEILMKHCNDLPPQGRNAVYHGDSKTTLFRRAKDAEAANSSHRKISSFFETVFHHPRRLPASSPPSRKHQRAKKIQMIKSCLILFASVLNIQRKCSMIASVNFKICSRSSSETNAMFVQQRPRPQTSYA